jgi:hypothetical protein
MRNQVEKSSDLKIHRVSGRYSTAYKHGVNTQKDELDTQVSGEIGKEFNPANSSFELKVGFEPGTVDGSASVI